jgi:hypothetical protein
LCQILSVFWMAIETPWQFSVATRRLASGQEQGLALEAHTQPALQIIIAEAQGSQ